MVASADNGISALVSILVPAFLPFNTTIRDIEGNEIKRRDGLNAVAGLLRSCF